MVDINVVPVAAKNEMSLLKTRLLDGEKIVAEFAETPVWNGFCGEGRIRHIQLTNRRINYCESYRKSWWFRTAPLLRQVFLKDVCEVSVGNYGRVGDSWLRLLVDFVFMLASPTLGIAFFVIGGQVETECSSQCGFFFGLGAVLVVLGLVRWIQRLCRKPVPDVVFGTRCPQASAFAVRLQKKTDRIRLLEEVTTLLSKNQ